MGMILLNNKIMEFIGTQTGGRYFDRSELRKGMTMLSFGVGEDISFELECEKHGLKIYCFDPTPKSIKYFDSLITKIEFYAYALYRKNAKIDFYLPENPDYASCSIENIQNTIEKIQVNALTLEMCIQVCNLNRKPDILKLDIEGTEYDVIDYMIDRLIFPKWLMIEFHHNKPTEDYIMKLSTHYSIEHQTVNDYLLKRMI